MKYLHKKIHQRCLQTPKYSVWSEEFVSFWCSLKGSHILKQNCKATALFQYVWSFSRNQDLKDCKIHHSALPFISKQSIMLTLQTFLWLLIKSIAYQIKLTTFSIFMKAHSEPSSKAKIELIAKIVNGSGLKYFHKKIHVRCLTGF